MEQNYEVVKGFQTDKGIAQYDYDFLANKPKVIKTINNNSPDENGNINIAISDEDINLDEYATEQWVSDNFQIKGDYATKIEIPNKPEDIGAQPIGNYATEQYVIEKINEASLGGTEIDLSEYAKKSELDNYAKTTEIPKKVSQLENDEGYLNKIPEDYATKIFVEEEIGKINLNDYAKITEIPKKVSELENDKGFLTEVPAGYATEEFVSNTFSQIDLTVYAKIEDIPKKVSQLENDKGYLTEHQDISGKLDVDKLPEAINDALEQAKESGEFKGESGDPGVGIKTIEQTVISEEDGGINTIAITKTNETVDIFNIRNGSKGSKGDKGETPVKGEDYYTEEDKEEMVNKVINALPVYIPAILTSDFYGDELPDSGTPGRIFFKRVIE